MLWGEWQNTYDYRAAALEFEQRYGITGIGRRYNMPPDHDLQSLEHEIKRRVKWANIPMNERLNRALAYADELTAFNPELARVRYDRDELQQVYDFTIGATSGYNPADIDFYINSRRGVLIPEDPGLNRLAAYFNTTALGLDVFWRPAPETVDLIIAKLETVRRSYPGSPGNGSICSPHPFCD